MPRRKEWQFKDMSVDEPVTMTLLFDRSASDDGHTGDDDEGFDWHKYPVQVDGEDYTMFTPNERVHQGLQLLKISKKGRKFTITKKLGENEKTGQAYKYYLIEANGDTVNTSNLGERKTPKPPEEPDQGFDSAEIFEPIARTVWDVAYAWITDGMEDITQEQRVQAKLALIKDCSTMVNTLVMVNGGKKA